MKTQMLHMNIKPELFTKLKMKAALLGLSIRAYVERLIDVNTQDISLEIKKRGKHEVHIV